MTAQEEAFEGKKHKLEVEKHAHARWWQEDTLVNNRITWLLQSQILLIAVYGLFARLPSKSAETLELEQLLAMLPFLGFSICLVISIGIHAAWEAQRILKDHYLKQEIEIGVHNATNWGGKITGYMLPLVFAGGWGWVCTESLWGTVVFSLGVVILVFIVDFVLKKKLGTGVIATGK